MRKHRTFWSVLLPLITLAGCGGSGGGTSQVSSPAFQINWPARSRDAVTSPGSALSVKVVIPGAGSGGTDITLNFDRTTGTAAAYTGTYQVGQAIPSSTAAFNLTFYAGAGESGKVVATAAAPVTWSGSNAVFGTVSLTGTVSKVLVTPPANLVTGDPAAQLGFDALDSSNTSLALSPGSANWAIASGASITLTKDGIATPAAVGTSTVTATVDGVASAPASVVVAAPVITVTDLTPSGAKAALTSIQGGQIGGYSVASGASVYTPVYWPSLTASPIDLTPSGVMSGAQVQAVYGTQQGGEAYTTNFHAALWSGTAGSFVDLNPSGGISSRVLAVGAGSQAGYAQFASNFHAALWSGTAGSFVDLNPIGATSSFSTAVTTSGQAGYATFAGNQHAGIWSGTPGSFVDIHPSGFTTSGVNCASGNVQAGFAAVAAGVAAEWTGTAASFVNLGPSGTANSEVNGCSGNSLAGYATYGTASHAILWNGSSHAFLDLNASVGAGYVSSVALAVEVTSKGATVVGYATTASSAYHGIVWQVPNALLP